MLKEKLKKLPSRIFYILFALVASMAFWIYIELSVNLELEDEISNIPVVFRNEDIFRDRGFIPTILTEDITLTLRASRADMNRLRTPGALSVEVNLANVTRTGAVQLDYDILWPQLVNSNAVDILGRSETLITLLIDREQERQIPVSMNYTGGTASPELVAGAEEYEPRFIIVRGPEEVVSRISEAYVPITRENLSSTITEDMGFYLIDEYGEQLDESLLESLDFSHYTIRVTIPISVVMDLPLTVSRFHGASTTDYNSTLLITPMYVTVSADPDIIREHNSIMLGTIDMTSFATSNMSEFPILIPEGMENISGETMATVYVEVLGLNIAYINTSIIYAINTPPGFRYDIVNRAVVVTLRGEIDDLMLVSPENIRVVADISDFSPGTSSVLARIYIHGIDAAIDPIGDYRVVVTLEPEPDPVDLADPD